MATTLSNITLSNNTYYVTGSNPTGSLTITTPTTSSFYIQYAPYIPTSFLHDYAISVTDGTSNISVRLLGSNLKITNATSNLCSVFSPYIIPNSFNTVGVNRYDNSVMVSVNASNIVRLTSSNELAASYSNSSILVTASNAGVFKDVTYQSVVVTNTAMTFVKPVKAVTIAASNITACNLAVMTSNISASTSLAIYSSNTVIGLSNLVVPQATFSSNVAQWSSNNLYPKSGGTITGNVGIKTTPSYELDVAGNIRLLRGAGNPATILINPTGVGNTQSTIQFVNSGHYITCFDSNINGWARPGTGHHVFYVSGGHVFSGPVSFLDSIGGTAVAALSNTAMFGSNTSISASNTATATSNAFYTSTAGSTATYASNTATWSSNNNINRTTESIATLTTSNITIRGTGVNPLCLVLSNLNNPGIVLYSSNASLEVAVSSITGGYSSDALPGDGIIRFSSNLYIQQGPFSSAICVNSNNRVGIQTKNPVYGLHVASTFFASNVQSPTIDVLSNTSFPALSTSIWASNAARFSSNQCATLCNLGNDAWNRATFSSNNFGQFVGSNDGVYSLWVNRNVASPSSSNYAIKQHYNGWTLLNGASNEGVTICEGDIGVASFINSSMSVGGNAPVPLYTLDVYGNGRFTGNVTLPRGSDALSGTFSYFAFNDGKNYIRGSTIMADTSNGEKVSIGHTTPAHKLDVLGTTRLSSLIVGSNSEEMKSIRHYTVSVLPNTSGTPRTVQVDAGGSYPSLCSIYAQMRSTSGYNDVFACTVVAQSTSNIRFSVARVDNSNWSQYPWLDFTVIGL